MTLALVGHLTARRRSSRSPTFYLLAPFNDDRWYKIYDHPTHSVTLYAGYDFEKLFQLPS